MKRRPGQNMGLVFLLVPLLLAGLACASQTLTPTLVSATPPGAVSPAQGTPTFQATTFPPTATPIQALAASPTVTQVGKVGDRLASGGVAVTVIRVTRTAQIGVFTAGPGSIYLDVDVLIENTSRADTILYNPFYFKVRDAEGNPYHTAMTALEPSLKTGDLEQGEEVRGHVAFEVNATLTNFILSFEPNVYLSNYQVIRFNLSQQSAHPVAVPTYLPPRIDGKAGERVVLDWIALTVVKLASPAAIGVYQPGQGRVFLDVEVIIENPSHSDSLPCNPLYFKVKDADGYEYTTALVSLDPSLKSGDLAPGEEASGHVAFEVRKEARGFVLAYEPVVLFKDYEEISIDLGE